MTAQKKTLLREAFAADGFASLSIYDVASAIRGPDVHSDAATLVKYVFTGRIRSLVGMTADFAITRRSRLSRDEAQGLIELHDEPDLWEAMGHCLGHCIVAAYVLKQPELATLARWLCPTSNEAREKLTIEGIIELAGGEKEEEKS